MTAGVTARATEVGGRLNGLDRVTAKTFFPAATGHVILTFYVGGLYCGIWNVCGLGGLCFAWDDGLWTLNEISIFGQIWTC